MANKIRPREPNRTKRNNRQSREIPIYERLLLLNLHARAIGAVLKNEAVYFGLMVEETRASLSQSVLETMDAREIHTSAVISKRRLRLEKKLLQ